ncbi:MAG: histidinol-phosphatase [Spirochaetales bacterium]|nr:histidinol-phosphatase [Spirochaetales bacterium]
MIYTPDKVNLHTHSFYCKHGSGTIADYVEQARKEGLKLLGFSEHCPLPDREYQKGNRMDYEDLPFYENDIKEAQRKEAERAEDTITILNGAECDWLPEEQNFYEELLQKRNYDYLSISVHEMFDPATGKDGYLGYFKSMDVKTLTRYVKTYTDGLRSSIFTFGCHPDLFMAGYRRWDADVIAASKDIIQCAIDCDIPLEFNDLGLRKKPIVADDGTVRAPYPVEDFWVLARDMGVKAITNSDAHYPKDVAAHKRSTMLWAQEIGLHLSSWELREDNKLQIHY